ncbi:MAG: hypothetical protein ABL917_02095 [Parcubacteria group bacterium]
MIYFLYGTDTHKARAKLHELLNLAQKKRPDAELFKITTENWSEAQLDELAVSQGLFEQKYTIVLDNLFEKKDIKEFVLSRLENMKDSEQIFLILEGQVDATSLKKIEKNAKQTQEFAKKENSKQSLNVFSITDKLLQRDKKNLWISYLDLLKKGVVAEELHGILFWQIKNMIIATKSNSQVDTGLSPFVYKNALGGGRNYKTEDLVSMSSELVRMTHKVRQGKGDLEVMMEKWILNI